MIKVLQIIDSKSFGGIVKLMLDIEKNLDEDIKFDFLTATNICDKWNNLNTNRETLKGKIIYNHKLYKFLRKNNYNVIHINSGAFFFTFQVLIISKLAGIKKVVMHSHNTPQISKYKKILIRLLNPLYCQMIDKKITCSKIAAKSLFSKSMNVVLIKDGIDVDNFKYNENIRNIYRDNLGINKKVVYGHIGRFAKQKNHELLIDIFYEIQKKQDAVLLLVGTGELKEALKEKTKKLNIENKVIFLGFRKDINNLLNAMDYFIFPSLYEGLAIAVVEAQTTGLPTFVSNGVPDDANISSNFIRINSNKSEDWANIILKTKISNRNDAYINTIKNGYDIKDVSKQLEEIYRNILQ